MNTLRLFSLLLACILLSSTACYASSAENTLVIGAGANREEFKNFSQATGIKIEVAESRDMMDTISTAYAIQDDRVDIYVFTAYQGLYLIKEKEFYVPMNESEGLMAEFDKLYAPLQRALMDGENVVGWFLNVQPITMENSHVLKEWQLPMPETFSEFLDTCKYIYGNELLEDKYTMMYVGDYIQEDILELYMQWYISANYIQGTVPDFTSDEFCTMVQRIVDEVPVNSTTLMSDDKGWAFCFHYAKQYISTEMLSMPRVLEGQDNAVEAYATIAVINPFSKNKETAAAFLEYCAQNPDNETQRYICDSTMTEPLIHEKNMAQLNAFRLDLEKYKQAETLTQEEKDRMAQLEESLIPEYESKCYWIDEEDIAYYQEFAQNLLVNEGSPVSYDAQLQQYASQYLSGLMTLEQFSQKCQSHIERIFKELQ